MSAPPGGSDDRPRTNPRWRPVDPAQLPTVLAEAISSRAGDVEHGRLRVALDGALAADPHGLAAALVEPLRARSHPAVHIRAESFWRDASLRLEFGHTDIQAFRYDWLDVEALRREVLDPLGPGGTGQYLTSLRDPATNRATRERRRPAEPGLIAIVSGELLLGRGLDFDVSIHLAVSAAALARRTPADRAWVLPAFADYERQVQPADTATIVIKLDDSRHPAVSAG